MTKQWSATADDFGAFIEWLDAGTESGGQSYIDMHARLVGYFARKGCTAPDDLADETLTRVARRLQEEGAITDVAPPQYCYIVARFVLLEYLRSADRKRGELAQDVGERRSDPDSDTEDLLARLDECLDRLSAPDRELILSYYSGDGPSRIAMRRKLAAKHGVSLNALAIRASRLRERLRICFGRRVHL